MKRLIIIFILFISIGAFSQDSTLAKRFSLGVGPTIGSFGLGATVGFGYNISNKISLKLNSICGIGHPLKGYDYYYTVSGTAPVILDASLSFSYFLRGNNNIQKKPCFYIGSGLGYYYSGLTRSYKFVKDSANKAPYSEKENVKALTINVSVGISYRIKSSCFFVEAYYSQAVVGRQGSQIDYDNGVISTRKIDAYHYDINLISDPSAILCFNFGYKLYF